MTPGEPIYVQVAALRMNSLTPSEIMRRLRIGRKQFNNAIRHALDRKILSPAIGEYCSRDAGDWPDRDAPNLYRESDEQAEMWTRLLSAARR